MEAVPVVPPFLEFIFLAETFIVELVFVPEPLPDCHFVRDVSNAVMYSMRSSRVGVLSHMAR